MQKKPSDIYFLTGLALCLFGGVFLHLQDLSKRISDRNQAIATEKEFVEAVCAGNKETAKRLLDYGVNVNAIYYDWTVLVEAVYRGDYEMVKLLLDYGADVTIEGDFTDTAIVTASKLGHKKIVELLLDYGAQFSEVQEQ